MSQTPETSAVNDNRLIRAEELSAALPPLMVMAERIAATVSQGVHGRRRVGQGEAFWQFRRYQFGDPVTNIDWRQTGKSRRVYIRQNEWEAAQTIWLMCDRSGSMDFSSGPDTPAKSERAAILTLALTSLLIRGGEHVALCGSDRPPSNTRAALPDMAMTLSGSADDGNPFKSHGFLPKNSRLVIFSDFLDDAGLLSRHVRAYAEQGVQGILVRIVDPAEETLPYDGRVVFEGFEDDGNVLVERVADARERYRKLWHEHSMKLAAAADQSGWPLVTHHTDHSPEQTLLNLYMLVSDSAAGRGRFV